MNWTQISQPSTAVQLRHGLVNSGSRGRATYSLHRKGAKGWVLKMYSGKTYCYGPIAFTTARETYNKLLTGNIKD